MYDYAIIIHPTNEELLNRYEPGMKRHSKPLVKKVLEWMSPFLAAEVTGLRSNLGRMSRGALVMCPLLMEQMVSLSPRMVMRTVSETLKFALGLNVKLIGLTAYTAFSGNKGENLAGQIPVALTTGANYTFAMIPEAILRAADLMEINLDKAYMLVIGGTTGVGKFCTEILSHFIPGMFVTAHNEDKLNIFLSSLSAEKRAKVHKVYEIGSIIEQARIIILATNHLPAMLDIKKIKPGSIIFDASYPRRIPCDIRNDILVIDGVAVKPPGETELNFDFGLPKGLCYPCMAEPMVLALERRFENYSLGKESAPNKIREIMRLGAKHGFEIAGLTSQDGIINNEDITKVKSAAQRNKKKSLLWR